MQHFAPTHFARAAWNAPVVQQRLTFQQWIAAYRAERARLGLPAQFDTGIAGERWDLNECPVEMAACDRRRADRLAEGWAE